MDRREQIAAIIVGAHPSEFDPATASPASRADWVSALKKADDIAALTPRHEAPAEGAGEVWRLWNEWSDDPERCGTAEQHAEFTAALKVALRARSSAPEAPAEGAGEYLNPGDLFWGVCRAFNTAANAAAVLRSNPEKIGLVIDALDGLKGEMDSVINDPSDPLRARSSAPEAREPKLDDGFEAWLNDRNLLPHGAWDWPSIIAMLNHHEDALVAKEAREGEAVGWFIKDQHGVWKHRMKDLNGSEPLYTHPAAPSADKLRIAVEALEPFARAAEKLDGLWSEDDWRWNDSVRSGVTVRDIRRADQALAALKAEGA